MPAPTTAFAAAPLSQSRTVTLILYNVALTLLLSWGLYRVVLQAADAEAARIEAGEKKQAAQPAPAEAPKPAAGQPAPADSAGTEEATPADSADELQAPSTDSITSAPAQGQQPTENDPRLISFVLIAITLAGALGGTLSNLRGVFEFTRENSGSFPAYLEMPFYLRPVSGMLCGLFTFFLSTFFAGALTQAEAAGWRTLDGLFPYIGIAFLAGFAAQEFMERLRDIARSVFGSSPAAVPVVTTEPAEGQPTGEGQENPLPLPETGGTESTGGGTQKSPKLPGAPQATQTPPSAPPPVITPQKRAD